MLKQMSKNVEALTSQVIETTAKVETFPDIVKRKASGGSQLGVLVGVKSLMKVRYWWHGMALDITDPIAKELDEFIEHEVSNLMELRARIRDGQVLTTEEFAFAQEDMNRLRDQAIAKRQQLKSKETTQ